MKTKMQKKKITAPTTSKLQESEEVEEQNNYLYVYGITNNESVNLDFKGLRDQPIIKIRFKDISALASPYPDLFPIPRDDEAMRHANIIKGISEKITIIPMSFGAVFKNQEILETVLRKAYLTVKNTLKLIENKVELGVKVVKKQCEDAFNGEGLEILESLKKLSVKNVSGDKFSDWLLLNYSFLIEKDKLTKFSEKIAELENKYQNLKFIYTGPWPPYSFVNIRIGGC